MDLNDVTADVYLQTLGVLLILTFVIQVAIAALVVHIEEENFWSIGRVMRNNILLLFFNEYKDYKGLTILINLNRILFVVLLIVLFLMTRTKGERISD
jgi:hypothetical protein